MLKFTNKICSVCENLLYVNNIYIKENIILFVFFSESIDEQGTHNHNLQLKLYTAMFRRRHSFLLIKMIAGLCLLYATKSFIETTIFGVTPVSLLQYRHTSRGVIDTKGCTIPDLDPLDPSIKSYVEYPYDIPKCPNPTMALLGSNRTTIWIRRETFPFYKISDPDELTCCYRSFYRPESTEGFDPKHIDDRVKYDDCVKLDNAIHVSTSSLK